MYNIILSDPYTYVCMQGNNIQEVCGELELTDERTKLHTHTQQIGRYLNLEANSCIGQ